MTRPIARIRLVFPGAAGQWGDIIERLGRGVADALASQGVVARLQTHAGPADGAPRADAALWFPAADGTTVAPDPRVAPARVHVAVVCEPASPARHLSRYDALFVPAARQLAAVREAVHTAPRQVPVVAVRLACVGPSRETEKAERGVVGRVVALDLRRGSSLTVDLERTLLQLQLTNEAGTIVLVTDDDGGLIQRLRALADRHGVRAFVASDPDAMASAIGASDAVVGTLGWHELLLAASARVAVMAVAPSASMASTSRSLLAALRDDRVIEELPGTIQLAAALDRMLHDDAGLMTRGLAVEGSLMHAPRELVQALGQVTPLTGTQTSVTHWQPIGPQAPAHADALVVAVDTPPKRTTAQRIEDDLAALKAKLAKETSS